MEIVVLYNGNINLPKERNHKTKFGYHQCSKKFKNVDDAACFIIECDFYSGSITTLEEIIPNGYEVKLAKILNEPVISEEEAILFSDKELKAVSEDDNLNSIL